MSRFDAHNGFVHFVFANEDLYCLKSLMALDLEGYLYYLLKRQGYRGIYFVGREEERFAVSTYDAASEELYARSDMGAFMTKMIGLLGGKDEQRRGRTTVPVANAEMLSRKWFPILRKEQEQAFVFRLDVFCQMFSKDYHWYLKELIRLGRQQPQGKRNILVLVAPIAASETARQLLDESGVFHITDRDGNSLCWEIQSLLRGDRNIRLYEQLQRELDERCLFLNSFDRRQLRSLVSYHYLIRQQEQTEAAFIEDVADLAYCWYHSPAFRAAAGPLFSQNERQAFSQLLADLSKGGAERSFRSAIYDLRGKEQEKSLFQLVEERYGLEPARICMPADDLIARKTRVIKVRPGILPQEQNRRLHHIISEFQIQRSRIMPEELTDLLLDCVGELESAIYRRDISTVGHVLTALEEALQDELTYGEREKVIWESRKTMIRLSEANFHLDQRRKSFLAQKQNYLSQMAQLRREIEENEAVCAYLEPEDPRRSQLAELKASFTRLYQDCRNLDFTMTQDVKTSNANDNSIRKLDLSIAALKQPDVKDLTQVLKTAQEMLVDVETERLSEQREIEDLNDKINYTFRELAAMDELPNAAERYEAAVRELDQLMSN